MTRETTMPGNLPKFQADMKPISQWLCDSLPIYHLGLCHIFFNNIVSEPTAGTTNQHLQEPINNWREKLKKMFPQRCFWLFLFMHVGDCLKGMKKIEMIVIFFGLELNAIFVNSNEKQYIFPFGTAQESIICTSGKRLRDPAVVPAPQGIQFIHWNAVGPCVLKQLPLGAAQHPMPKIRHANDGDDGQLIWSWVRLCVECLLSGWFENHLVWHGDNQQSWLWCTGGTKTVLLAQVLQWATEFKNQTIFPIIDATSKCMTSPKQNKATRKNVVWRHGVDMPICWRTTSLVAIQKKNDAITCSGQTKVSNIAKKCAQ